MISVVLPPTNRAKIANASCGGWTGGDATLVQMGDVAARAERVSGTGEYHTAHRRISGNALEMLVQRAAHLVAKRVHHLGAIKCDRGNAALRHGRSHHTWSAEGRRGHAGHERDGEQVEDGPAPGVNAGYSTLCSRRFQMKHAPGNKDTR